MALAVRNDGAHDPRSGGERRCFVTGEVRPRQGLVRFVVDPSGTVVPDVAGTLPGRGLWLTASRDIVERARRKGQFARAQRGPAAVPDDLADRVERLLARRCIDLIGLARRAGQVTAGFDQVAETLRAGRAGLLIEAADAAAGGAGRLRALGAGLPVVAALTADELGQALGRERAVHLTVARGRLAGRLVDEAARLAGFRDAAPAASTERSASGESDASIKH
jgi:predicted RNA-binding protein YlxR (DUF448 family)